MGLMNWLKGSSGESKKPEKESIQETKEEVYYCITCGDKIPKEEYERNDGQCDHCVIEDSAVGMIYDI